MDKQTADAIITQYLPKIYGFAIKHSFSYEEAEDLCAEIVHEAYRSLRAAKEVLNMEGYIWRISKHTHAKYVASKKRHEGIAIDQIVIPFWEEGFLEEARDEIIRLRREIAFLTEKRREIVYLFYYKDKSVSDISKAMRIPTGTVKWHLNQARHELQEGFAMERKIGRLGLSPIVASSIGHSGTPGSQGGPEYYLGDKLNLNIVYSVYHSPKTKEEIAEELGVTLVYIQDRIELLESNGFLQKTTGSRFTTYVRFTPETFSLEMRENKRKKQMKIAQTLVKEYMPAVREAISSVTEVYIPGENRELLEAAAVFYGVMNKCRIPICKDLSKYVIKTTDGGEYIAFVELKAEQSDVEYQPTLPPVSYWACGDMTRVSEKYPSVASWSIDTRLCSRQGAWQNNLTADYEYVYEFLNGFLCDNAANAEKLQRLRERAFLTPENQINIMMVKERDFFEKIPPLDDAVKERFAHNALEYAMMEAKNYPSQMQDLVMDWGVAGFIGAEVALMVMDILYGDGILRPLTENEKVTSNLIMFSDIIP